MRDVLIGTAVAYAGLWLAARGFGMIVIYLYGR